MSKKKREQAELDTETTIADMNVEGFSWYDPKRKNRKRAVERLTKTEQRALMRGMFRAMFPLIGSLLVGALLVLLLAYLWLK